MKLLAALALALALAASGAQAAIVPAPLAALQALDARVQNTGWRLAQGNARYCTTVAPGIGLLLQDVAGYGDPDAVRAALGFSGDIAVQAVAADAPAARAGLAPNDPLEQVAGYDVAALTPARAGDYARLAGLHDRIDAALGSTGRVELVRAGTVVTIVGEPACVARFELLASGIRAAADGRRVVIGRKLVEALPADPLRGDELLAAALAHELAHNVLGHRARLDATGRAWSKVKVTEREADRLSVWLLANAGYDPEASLRFFARWGPMADLGPLSSPDHDRWKTRVKRITAEIGRMRAAMMRNADGEANWARDFLAEE